MSRYISPFTDFGFKKIFGEEPNKDLLIDFLNEILSGQNHHIKDLTYKKNDYKGRSDIDRSVIFDLYCENDEGEKFIVEMQKAKQTHFKDRTLYYSTFPIQEQAVKGGNWNYELKSVFAIGILGFAFDDEDKDETVVNRVQLFDNTTQKVFYDKLTFIFIQMKNFNKTIDELETHLDKWLYVLKHMDTLERIPEKIKEKIFKKVFKIAELNKLSKNERDAYEDSLKYHRDLVNSYNTATNEGFNRGYNKAEEELAPKIEEANIKVAKLMKQLGKSVKEISKETGLTEEDIQKL